MNLAKLLLLGGAGFLAYRYYQRHEDPAGGAGSGGGAKFDWDSILGGGSAGGSSGGGYTQLPVVNAPPGNPPVTNPVTTRSLVQAEAAKHGFTIGSVHQWNWYYLQARGVAPPSPDQWGLTPDDDNRQMTFDEWWALASGHGLSGIVPFEHYGAYGPNELLVGPGGYRMVG